MFTLLLLSAVGRLELFALLIVIALVVGYFIGHIHRIVQIANSVYASVDERIALENQRIHKAVQNDINDFEARYATLVGSVNRDVEGWEKDLRLSIARALLGLRNVIHLRFTGNFPAYGAGVMISRPDAEQASTQENQAQANPMSEKSALLP